MSKCVNIEIKVDNFKKLGSEEFEITFNLYINNIIIFENQTLEFINAYLEGYLNGINAGYIEGKNDKDDNIEIDYNKSLADLVPVLEQSH